SVRERQIINCGKATASRSKWISSRCSTTREPGQRATLLLPCSTESCPNHELCHAFSSADGRTGRSGRRNCPKAHPRPLRRDERTVRRCAQPVLLRGICCTSK